jgi:serine/threonine-protein phosphatase 2B catalytic subunit
MHRWDGPASFPYVITIFSAPNYCGYYENKASVLIIDKGNLSLKQYDETEPPYRLPDNMDVFSWSMPFLAEKVVSMLYTIVRRGCDDDDDDEVDNAINKDVSKMTRKRLSLLIGFCIADEAKAQRGLIMKGKVRSVARVNRMFTTLR